MPTWIELIMSSPIGWMSVLVIIITCIIVGYLGWMFWSKSAAPEN